MLQKNLNTCIIRSLVSFGIVLSNLTLTEILAVSAQSSDPDRGIECMKKYSAFYYSYERLRQQTDTPDFRAIYITLQPAQNISHF